MANIHRGEVTINLAGRAFTLRPTFHNLCHIEERTGRSIAELATGLATRGLLMGEIVTVLALATRHDGSDRLDSDWLMSLPVASLNQSEVLQGLAEFFATTLPLLEWEVMQETAYGVLGLSPELFWQMTLPEFSVMLHAARRKQRQAAPAAPQHPSANDLVWLKTRFPDQHHAA